jgi:XTP/dITP diphosphohydrolase
VRLLVATHNRGKLAELRELFADIPGLELVALADLGRALPEVVEDGRTFEENAAKKAREYARAAGLPALADDSGLEVDALAGQPGVLSARFAGPRSTDGENNRLLLQRLEGFDADERTARFRCVLALCDPGGPLGAQVHLAEGVCEGRIVSGPRGTGGFGYDPLFVPAAGSGATFAELGDELKNRISHRAIASRAMRDFLRGYVARREGSG